MLCGAVVHANMCQRDFFLVRANVLCSRKCAYSTSLQPPTYPHTPTYAHTYANVYRGSRRSGLTRCWSSIFRFMMLSSSSSSSKDTSSKDTSSKDTSSKDTSSKDTSSKDTSSSSSS